jgi:type II secretory pathway predicted ATPase ExeA
MSEHLVYSRMAATAERAPIKAENAAVAGKPNWSFHTVRHLAAQGLVDVEDGIVPLPETRFAEGRVSARVAARKARAEAGFKAETLDIFANAPRAVPRGKVSALDIYTRHFGLNCRPFSLVPDPDFLFWTEDHRNAYTMLEYGVLTKAPITLITGDIGTGKTTLLHHLIRNVTGGVKFGLISNTQGSRAELLRWIMMSLGQPTSQDATQPELYDAFQRHVIAEYARGNRVILMFDEAQNLGIEVLEELRMLTNINTNKDELLQLVLVGQPELRKQMEQPELAQFAQRVAASFHLGSMDKATVRAYIAHRLQVAGQPQNIFSEAATDLIAAATDGIPRRINQLCDLALVYAFTNDQRSVVRFTVQQVLEDGTFFGGRMPTTLSATAGFQ